MAKDLAVVDFIDAANPNGVAVRPRPPQPLTALIIPESYRIVCGGDVNQLVLCVISQCLISPRDHVAAGVIAVIHTIGACHRVWFRAVLVRARARIQVRQNVADGIVSISLECREPRNSVRRLDIKRHEQCC